MRCFSCIKPNRNDIKIDTEHAPRSSSRCSYGSSGFFIYLFPICFFFGFCLFIYFDKDKVWDL
jgi:hypothetical protein